MDESTSPPVHVSHDVADLLGLLPVLFGFRPVESVVVIATQGARRRFGFRARLDLPPSSHARDAARLLAGHLVRQEPDAAIAVIVSQDEARSVLMLEELADAAADVGLPIDLAVRATADRYWVRGPGSPADGVGYDSSVVSPAVAMAVVAGEQVLQDRETLARRFAPVAGERAVTMGHATDEVVELVASQLADPGAPAGPIGMRILAPLLAKGELDEASLTPHEVATLAVWVSSIAVRDEVWSLFTRANARDALRVWTRVAQDVVPPFEPPVLCLAAFAAWLAGDGAQALIAAERAERIDPHYSLTGLVLEILEAGISPDTWAHMEPQSQSQPRRAKGTATP